MESKVTLKRKLILQTAIQLVVEQDLQSLTLDGVAKKAGISKGGLMYHFASKDQLLISLADYIFEQFAQNFYDIAESMQDARGKWTLAMIEASRQDLYNSAYFNIAVTAMSLVGNSNIEDLASKYQELLQRLEEDAIDKVTLSIIRLTLDGLYYSRLLNIAPVGDHMQDEVLNRLVEMARKDDRI